MFVSKEQNKQIKSLKFRLDPLFLMFKMKKINFIFISLLFISSLLFSADTCSNYETSLLHQTFDLSGREEYIDDNSEFETVLLNYQDKEIGKGYTENIDGTLNPYSSQQDDYLTQFTGFIDITSEGNYTFAVDGDDAVELLIDDTVVAAWYGGHAPCGCTTHTGSVNLSVGKHKIEFRHHERSGGVLFRLYWKKPLDSDFTVVPAGNLFHCSVLPPNAEFKFDECSWGDSTFDVKDSSSSLLHGTSNNAYTTSDDKILTRSADFTANSNDDYVELNASILNGASDFSIAMWIKGNSTENQALISGANSTQNNAALLFITNSGTRFASYIKDGVSTVDIPDITDNTWHHLIWDRNGTSGDSCLIIDGNTTSKYCVVNLTGSLEVEGLIVAQDQDNVGGGFASNQDFEGYMDELKIYDSILSDSDIQKLYENEKNGYTYDGSVAEDVFCSSNTCSNFGEQLNISTYDVSSYIGAQIDSNDEFNTVISTYANSTYEFGSGFIDDIDTQGSNNNSFGSDEKYLTLINGFLYVPTAGDYSFMVNGDDAVEVLIDGVVVSSWYSGHGASGSPETNTAISKLTITLAQGYHDLEFHHHEYTGNDSFELYWKQPSNATYEIIPASNFYHCLPAVPLVEYRFDECDEYNGTIGEVKDNTANNFDANTSDITHLSSAQIYKGAKFSASSITDYIDVPTDVMDGKKEFTIAVWIKSGATQDQAIISGANSSEQNEMLMFVYSSGNVLRAYIKGGYSQVSIPDITDYKWHHVVWRRNTTGKNCITVDGNTTNCANGSIGALDIEGLIIGQEQDSVKGSFDIAQNFEGSMDEFKIYDNYLSDDEVKDIYTYEKQSLNYDGSERENPLCNLATCYTDNFNRTDLGTKWDIIKEDNFTPQIDSNKLIITDLTKNVASGVSLIGDFPSSSNYIEIEFEQNTYTNNYGADGMAVVLSDANTTPVAGGYGGSLGYANRGTYADGFAGGWLGIGIDEFGNFSSTGDGKTGGIGKTRDSVTIRGNEVGVYSYIANSGTLIPGIDSETAQNYKYKILIDTRDDETKITVTRDINDGAGYKVLINEVNATQSAEAPNSFRLSFTGSTGSVNNIHSIDNLKVKALFCGTLGKSEEILSSFFDAWDVDKNINKRTISTKKVSQDFNLTIASLNEDNNISQEYNGTVQARIVYSSSCPDGNNNITDFVDVNLSNKTKDTSFKILRAIKDASVQIKTDDNITCSSDNFAVRPDKFMIQDMTNLKAGEAFDFNVSANTNALDYNTSVHVDINISDSDKNCSSVTADFNVTSIDFVDGVSITKARFDDIGVVDINITDKDWAKIDENDTDQDCNGSWICGYQNDVKIIPYKFDINGTYKNKYDIFTYLSQNLNMSSTLDLNITAQNEQNLTTQNYSATCYANNIDINIQHSDVNSSNLSRTLYIYQDASEMNSTENNISKDDDLILTYSKNNFTTDHNGTAEVTFFINFDRDRYKPVNQFDFSISDINATDVDGVNGTKNLDQNATFYYGRVKTKDVTTNINDINNSLHVEVYSTVKLDERFHQESLNWYVMADDDNTIIFDLNVTEDFQQSDPEGNVTLNLDSDLSIEDGEVSFSMETDWIETNSAYIHVNIPDYLWFNKYNDYNASGDCSNHPCFEYNYIVDKNGSNIHSGTFSGTSIEIGSDYNATKTKKGVKVFR